MTRFEFGEVLLVPFPFTDQSAAKKRPAVVISSRAYSDVRPDLIIMAITSQLRDPPGFGDTVMREWQAAGLPKPSVIKPVITTIEKGLIVRTLGHLQAEDRAGLARCLAAVLGRSPG